MVDDRLNRRNAHPVLADVCAVPVELQCHGPDLRRRNVLDGRILEVIPGFLHYVGIANHRWLAVRNELRAGLIECQDGSRTIEMTVPVSFFDVGNFARCVVFVRSVARGAEADLAASRPNCAAVMPDGAASVELKRHFSFSLIRARIRSMSAGSNSFRRPIGM